jgi:hypothetical protein
MILEMYCDMRNSDSDPRDLYIRSGIADMRLNHKFLVRFYRVIITSLASISIIMSSSVVSATPSIRSSAGSELEVMAGVEDGKDSSYVEEERAENDCVPGRPKGKRK